tara:strand:- start:800 stop:985 length:186 start_codon:yes stop_codon:yes gene_type:complete
MSEKNKEKKSVFTKRSEAGKGDSPRRGISVDEWGKKWEAIFRSKKKKLVRSHKSNNSGSES